MFIPYLVLGSVFWIWGFTQVLLPSPLIKQASFCFCLRKKSNFVVSSNIQLGILLIIKFRVIDDDLKANTFVFLARLHPVIKGN